MLRSWVTWSRSSLYGCVAACVMMLIYCSATGSLITRMKHCVHWPVRVHILFRLEVKHISSLLYWLWAVTEEERHSRQYITGTGCFFRMVSWLKWSVYVYFSPSREVELIQSDRTLEGVGHILMHFQLLCCLPFSQMFWKQKKKAHVELNVAWLSTKRTVFML